MLSRIRVSDNFVFVSPQPSDLLLSECYPRLPDSLLLRGILQLKKREQVADLLVGQSIEQTFGHYRNGGPALVGDVPFRNQGLL